MEAPSSANANAPETDVSALRSAIDAKLRDEGVYVQIRQLIQEAQAKQQQEAEQAPIDGHEPPAMEHLIQHVLESDVVQQLLAAVRIKTADAAPTRDKDELEEAPEEPSDKSVCLYLRLTDGRAFVEQLMTTEDDEQLPDDSAREVGDVRCFFRVIATFQQQRLESRDVLAAVEPRFDEHLRFSIDAKPAPRSGKTTFDVEVVSPWEALCMVDEPVQIHLLKLTKRLVRWEASAGATWLELSRELLACHRIDWRRVLCSTLQLVHFPEQLVSPTMKAPIGTLDFRADVLHFKRNTTVARNAAAFLNKDALRRNAASHTFYQYAKQWWSEYRAEERAVHGPPVEPDAALSARPRLVKLFAEDEEGRFRMVCTFVTKLRVPAAIRSPSEAARFVGLLPYEANALVGGARDETWRSPATFLAVGKGDAQDHALLLASLLLGFGLDTFVCIGTIAKTPKTPNSSRLDPSGFSSEVGHVWVLTRAHDTSGVTFWESVTGERFQASDKAAHRRYCSIDCAFNAHQFYANLQPRSWRLPEWSFAFEDDGVWKAMSEATIATLPFRQPCVAIRAPDVAATAQREQEWTSALKTSIASRRRALGLATRWSSDLSFFLLPALNSYEMERLYGVAQLENDLFQQSITRFVPEGHTFEGVPLVFTSESATQAASALETHPLGKTLVSLHTRGALFGLAVRCFAYPESVFVSWVMLAVSYQSTT